MCARKEGSEGGSVGRRERRDWRWCLRVSLVEGEGRKRGSVWESLGGLKGLEHGGYGWCSLGEGRKGGGTSMKEKKRMTTNDTPHIPNLIILQVPLTHAVEPDELVPHAPLNLHVLLFPFPLTHTLLNHVLVPHAPDRSQTLHAVQPDGVMSGIHADDIRGEVQRARRELVLSHDGA